MQPEALDRAPAPAPVPAPAPGSGSESDAESESESDADAQSESDAETVAETMEDHPKEVETIVIDADEADDQVHEPTARCACDIGCMNIPLQV